VNDRANRRASTTPDYIFPMVRRSPPVEGVVVEGSTPVVAFGDPTLATVATLGINPSTREFLEDGRLLTGTKRRLATLGSLGADSLEDLTDSQVAEVVADCATYFHRRPYERWFDPLDKLLRAALGASYYDGSACHLDLVQWATDPVWSRIPSSGRRALLNDGVPHLRAQLQREHVRLVVLNGRAVIKQVQATGLAELEVVGRVPLREQTFELVAGTADGVEWRGWSANLQGSYGVSSEFRDQLAAWLRETAPTSVEPPLSIQTTVSGRGTDSGTQEAKREGNPRPSRTSGGDSYLGNEYTEVFQEWIAEKDPVRKEEVAQRLDRIIREDG
jgi:hypothetical protein